MSEEQGGCETRATRVSEAGSQLALGVGDTIPMGTENNKLRESMLWKYWILSVVNNANSPTLEDATDLKKV